MRKLPECPKCEEDQTLEAVRIEGSGFVIAFCSCCALTVRVSPEGHVTHRDDPKTDIMGNMMDSD